MVEVLDVVYNLLSTDATLTGLVAGIYHQHAPAGGRLRYPFVVYSQLSDYPALTTDNAERERRVTIRLHIVARQGQYAAVYARVHALMIGAGFMRHYTNDIFDDGDFVRIVDYRIGVES